MTKFWTMVNEVIEEADVLLLVLDARMADETRNDEIEKKVKETGKPLIYVLNKCDLVDKHVAEEQKHRLPHSIFISAKDHLGTTMLRERIMVIGSKLDLKRVKVGVLGYPNVGKSSVINALKGRGTAQTSSMSGHTRHIKKIRTSKIVLLDTPGVIPYSDGLMPSGIKHAMIGSIDHTKEKNPDVVVMQLLARFPGLIEEHYGVPIDEDPQETIERIAVRCNFKSQGGVPDSLRAARMILKDWQTGKITRKRE